MTRIVLSLAIFSAFYSHCFAQAKPVPLTYSEVVEVSDSTTRGELFLRGREWFAETFKSSKEVLQINDKESGELVGKGIFNITYIVNYWGLHDQKADVDFTLSLWVKDGRYKYEMSNFNVQSVGGVYTNDDYKIKFPGLGQRKSQEIYLNIVDATKEKAQTVIQSLKAKMAGKSKSSDW